INNSGTTTASKQINGIGIANALANNVVYVTNTTISGNTSQMGAAGILTVNAKFYIYNSTITNNVSDIPGTYGGGIHNNVTEIRNTIVAGNTNDFVSCTATNVAYSIIGSTSGLTVVNDLGGNQFNTNPLLGTLQQYKHTWCHPFAVSNPPHNNGTDLTSYGITTDQRGVARPQSTAYDVGAFELEDQQ
ncbi:MAG: choice-of-anchor Q domain-containing protein, partial [Candidatus Pacearchaeota archaeon]